LITNQQNDSGLPPGFGTITRSNSRNLPPPSPVIRRSSTQESCRRPNGIRKSATLDNPEFNASNCTDTRDYTPSRMMTTDMFSLPRDYSRGSIGSRDATPVQQQMSQSGGWPDFPWNDQVNARREHPVYYRSDSNSGRRDIPLYMRSESSGGREIPVHASDQPSDYSRRIPASHNRNSMMASYSREPSIGRDTPNFSRYSSILDDKHDWGFSTLARRNSKSFNRF